jgi:dipeptidyl-peptidase-4
VSTTEAVSFPRRQARTRRFTLGAPRDFEISADGETVAFLRSQGPEDPVNSLWVLDVGTGRERLVVDAASIGPGSGPGIPDEERTRRERTRETGEGIVSYDATTDIGFVALVVNGHVVRAELGRGEVDVLPCAPGAFDARISPDGSAVAYVAGDALRIVDSEGDRDLIGESLEGVTWGQAEFVAAEEMGRARGFWWAPTGDRLLVERVDVSPVAVWWISSPVDPATPPRPVRFPAAGTDNADVELAIVGLDGARTDVLWRADGWEYLAHASWTDQGLILAVQSRDQKTFSVLDVDAVTGACRERYRTSDQFWVDLVPGSPRLAGDRLVTVEDRGAARRLCVDGVALTGDDVQVRRVVHHDDSGVVVSASVDPTEVHVAHVGWDGSVEWITSGPGVHAATVGGPTMVVTSRSVDRDGATSTVFRGGERIATIGDLSARPGMRVNLELIRAGAGEITTAVLFPRGHEPDEMLPVLLDPYGGPHHQRVQKARALFDTSQWFADQGFVVVIADGRGTPGRGPAFERSIRGDLASKALQDQIDALQAVADRDERLDLRRVALRGWSFGGYLATLAVLRAPEVFHAAIAGAPVTEWRLYDTHYTERYLGHPDEEPDNYERSSLLTEAASLSRPLMLIHGLADDNVYAAHTLRLSRALLEAGRPHTVLPLSGVTHMTPQEEVAENLLLIQLAFLRDALGLES